MPKLAAQPDDPQTSRQIRQLPWYSQGQQTVEIVTGIALWYCCPQAPLPIRGVLVRSPRGTKQSLTAGLAFVPTPRCSHGKQEVLYLHREAEDLEELRRQVQTFLDQFQADSPTLLGYVGLLPPLLD